MICTPEHMLATILPFGLCLIYIQARASASNDGFNLADKTFRLDSLLSVIDVDSSHSIYLEEYYSSEQRRARIHRGEYAKTDSRKKRSEIYLYHDAKMGARVLHSPDTHLKCQEAKEDQFIELIYGDDASSKMSALLSNVRRDSRTDHISGSARVLVLIAQMVDQLRKDNQTQTLPIKVRNHPAIQYNLELMAQGISINIFYECSNPNRNHPRELLPLQVVISFTHSGGLVLIDFMAPKLLQSDWIKSEFGGDIYQTLLYNDRQMDLFNFPIAERCLEKVDGPEVIRLLPDISPDSVKFSFRASSKANMRIRKHFVAYDGFNSLLRVDSHWIRSARSEEPIVRDRTRISDLRANRKYVIDTANHLTNKSALSKDQKVNRCVVTYEDAPSKTGRHVYFNLSDYLLGAESFKYVGRARVKGVKARIFEAPVSRLPGWFASAMVFGRHDDDYRVLRRGNRISGLGQVSEGRPMAAVVYVTEAIGLTGDIRLLRLEYYYIDHKTAPVYREALTAEMDDFSWHLSESPNEEPVEELFSLADHCATEADTHYEVDMLFKEELDNSSTRDLFKTWLADHPRGRSDIIKTAVLDMLDVQNVGMTDFEAKIRPTSAGTAIATRFKLQIYMQPLTTIKFMGRANFIGRSDQVKSIATNSLVDCLWILGKEPQDRRILYLELIGACLVELAEGNHYSQVFNMTDGGGGALYSISAIPDTSSSLSQSWLSDRRFQHLEGRAIILDIEESKEHIETKLRLKRVRMNQMNHIGATQSLSGHLIGLSLPDAESYTKMVAHDPGDQPGPMSFARCEAACLADFTCKSFSFCDGKPETKCILSTLNTVTESTIEQVTAAKVHKLVGGERVEITLPDTRFKLIRNFRCETHGKNYLSLFQSVPIPVQSTLRLKSVEMTNDIGHCAELCFAKSVQAIEAAGKLHNQVEHLTADNRLVGMELKSKVSNLHEQNSHVMSKFCKSFFYSDSGLDNKQLVALDNLKQETGTLKIEEARGYCVLEDNDRDERYANADSKTVSFNFGRYDFDFSTLYEKQVGFKLLGTPVNDDEYEAFQVAKNQQPASATQLELLKHFISKGKNLVSTKNAHLNACARDCFLQVSGVWPACRSFDMVLNGYAVERDAFVCQLNTQSAETASPIERQAEYKDSTKIKFIHYEPRFKFVSDIMDTSFQLDQFFAELNSTINRFISSTAMVLMITFWGIVSGFYIGATQLGPRIFGTRLSARNDDQNLLPVDSITARDSVASDRSYFRFDDVSGVYASGQTSDVVLN